jgi:hypothetical protein
MNDEYDNTDDYDNAAYDMGKEYIESEQARDWSYDKLLEKYNHLKEVTLENLPHLWPGLEFALSVKSILNIKGCTLPFAGILLGPASSQKTLIIECFRGSKNTFYTDNFSPKSLVSHISGKTEEQLRKSDLLPKLKNKFFMTPELAPVFSSRDDDLLQLIGILTRVLDGQGYESDSGAQGHRGYDEEIMFTWLGACIDISPKVYRLLSTLGPKLYFYRLDRIEETEDTYFDRRNQDFAIKKSNVRTALLEYLAYFDINPDAQIQKDLIDSSENEDGLRKIDLDTAKDEELAHRVIIRVARVLARLRALVPTWETTNTQGSEYGYRMANIEDPTRAIQQLTNLARGHALSMDRRYITLADIPVVIHTALSTASIERVRIFELLIEYKGVLSTESICESLNTSKNTALRTMTELKATGLVAMDNGDYQTQASITLNRKYEWFLSSEFQDLKQCQEKYPPQKGAILMSDFGSNGDSKSKESDTIIGPLSGGEISLHQVTRDIEKHQQEPLKPLEQWTSIDFVLNACIYCNNNGGYKGPPITTPDEYDRHIIKKHAGKPAYPGPADIQLYGLKLNGNGHNGSKAADAADDNQAGNGILGQMPKKEELQK